MEHDSDDFTVSAKDRALLENLARKQSEAARLPVMRERTERLYAHNALEAGPPMIVMETKYCLQDLVDLECESPFARELEMNMKRHLATHELVDDDTVVPDFFEINAKVDIKELGFDMVEKRAKDADGNSVGYETEHFLENLAEDFPSIGKTVRTYDREYTERYRDAAENIVGRFLPVVFKNPAWLNWYASPAKKIVHLMGTTAMMLAPYDCPDEYRRLWDLLTDSALDTFDWLADNGLLCLNNGNDYAGSGSYGFSRGLPTEACSRTGKVTTKDLWVNLNAQESVGVSPAMYCEFFFEHYLKLAGRFGLVYYGCCEPLDPLWDDYISKIPNLRKVSVSPWADLELMGDKLRGTDIIYSRKPSPNMLALRNAFDHEAYRAHIREGVVAARGCRSEIVCRDVYALYGDRAKLGQAVKIIRETVEDCWKP